LSFLVIYVIPMTTLTSFQLVFLYRRQQLYQYINTRSSATAERQRVIYVIPMTTLVALNGRILAALWRASRGPVTLAESTQMTTGSQRGRDDHAMEDGGKPGTGSRCSRHGLSNCSRCGADSIVIKLSDTRPPRLVGYVTARTANK